ncbi:MAG: GDP-L-fucose synthase [Chlorobi bacterium]|nr:GDP-L-fucose synthase [Chlorobiota bacterium]
MKTDSRIYIAGHRGMVGSAILRRLQRDGYKNLLARSRDELDLRRQADVEEFFDDEQPEYVFLAAAKVGGIHANNTYKADFILDNLQIQTNVITAAYQSGVKKLLFLGSSCIYPKIAPQPITEESLLTGSLEPTNEPYAIAKIAGLKACQFLREQYGVDFISMMPTNLYGPNDNFDLKTSHVLPALIRKFHDAKVQGARHVEVWGTGSPRREFLHVDDCADAGIFLMENYSGGETINVGWGEDISIRKLAELIQEIIGFEGEIIFNRDYPDGTPRKLLDTSRINQLGWRPKISLRDGITSAYSWFKEQRQLA